ncbi:hypothetical protein DFAR_1470027 [Desulfarculales bacterium]
MVKEHGAAVRTKGFSCWIQFVAMLFCHLARADSLREICQSLFCCLDKLSHLEVSAAPKRSTLPYANQHRPSSLFRALFFKAMERFRAQGSLGRKKRRIQIQEPAPEPGLLYHHPVPKPVPLSRVEAGQGRGQGSHHSGPQQLHAQLCPAHRGQGGRYHRAPGAGTKP